MGWQIRCFAVIDIAHIINASIIVSESWSRHGIIRASVSGADFLVNFSLIFFNCKQDKFLYKWLSTFLRFLQKYLIDSTYIPDNIKIHRKSSHPKHFRQNRQNNFNWNFVQDILFPKIHVFKLNAQQTNTKYKWEKYWPAKKHHHR